MKITEVRIFPTESRDGKLKAFATMTFDDWFVVRNVKIIQGNNGLFVAMPSRKAMDSCPKCRFKNVRGSKFCNQCGAGLPAQHAHEDEHSGDKTGNHMDIAHPITQECRVYIQEQIIDAYNDECEKQKAQGSDYKPAEDISLERTVSAGPEAAARPSPAPEIDPGQDIEL